jgi:hypothetical protein
LPRRRGKGNGNDDRQTPLFALFKNLAPELREQIWRETLPTVSGSALFSYRKGCWIVRDPAKGETGFEPGFPNHLQLLFLYESLGMLYFDIPIFFVNSETRDIAITWLREQGLKKFEAHLVSVSGHQQSRYTFMRTFRPDCNILYIPDNKSADFRSEPIDRITQCEYDSYSYSPTCEISRIAISETLFSDCFFEELLQLWNYHIKELFIIVGPQPEKAWADGEDSILARWELDSWNGGSYR